MILRLLETIHGHLGILAAAALLHPAILLRTGSVPTRRGKLSVLLTSAMVVLAFASGLFIYPHYRQRVRAGLFHASVRAGFAFETKEHLAYAVIAATLGASIAVLVAPKQGRALRRAAATLYALAALLCIAVVALGSYVASVHGFPSE
jgi:hypothetical protein